VPHPEVADAARRIVRETLDVAAGGLDPGIARAVEALLEDPSPETREAAAALAARTPALAERAEIRERAARAAADPSHCPAALAAAERGLAAGADERRQVATVEALDERKLRYEEAETLAQSLRLLDRAAASGSSIVREKSLLWAARRPALAEAAGAVLERAL